MHEIKQSFLDIDAHAYGTDNAADLVCGSIVTDQTGGFLQFVWTYDAKPISTEGDSGRCHRGTHIMRISFGDGEKFAEGHYFNDRLHEENGMGGGGFFKLKRASAELRGAINFCESNWAMSKQT